MEVNFISHAIKMLIANDLSADAQCTVKRIGGTVCGNDILTAAG